MKKLLAIILWIIRVPYGTYQDQQAAKKFWGEVLRHDRLEHFFVGFLLFVALDAFLDPYFAWFIAGTIGIGIEVYQGFTKTGKAQALDGVYFFAPATLIIFSCYLFV